MKILGEDYKTTWMIGAACCWILVIASCGTRDSQNLDLVTYMNIPEHHTSERELFEAVSQGPNYDHLLSMIKDDVLKNREYSQCGQIVGLRPHLDHLIAKAPDPNNPQELKSIHYPNTPGNGEVYALFYRGKTVNGSLDPIVRIGLITLPPSLKTPAPLLMWFREWYGDMDYGHIANRVAELQLDHVVASKPFPGEALLQKNKDRFISGVGEYGDELYDADAMDSLVFHHCIQKLNAEQLVPMGSDNRLVSENFLDAKNPFYKKIALNCAHDAQCKSVHTIYAGYSRGGGVATIAVAKLGALMAAGVDPEIHVSALATIAPLGSWIDDYADIDAASKNSDQAAPWSVHRNFIYWLFHKHRLASLEQKAFLLAKRDLAFLVPYLTVALRNWSDWFQYGQKKPGAVALIMHEADKIFPYKLQHVIFSTILDFSQEKLARLVGSSNVFAKSFVYIPTPLSGTQLEDVHSYAFELTLKRPETYETLPVNYAEAISWTRRLFKSALNGSLLTYGDSSHDVPYVIGRIIFQVWTNTVAASLAR